MWDNVAGNVLIGNRPPTIGLLPTFTAEEDTPMVLELTQYESDVEDSGTDLDWMVTSYDVSAIASISGTKSDNDIITLTPVKDFDGSTEIELTLTDSGGQSTKKTTDVVWTPVNDAPTIASLDRTKSSVYRTESLTFKVYGDDIDDTLAQVNAEVEVSLQGSGGWTPLGTSKYNAGHWDVTWTLDKEDDIGTYDVRARLVDLDGLMSDWLTRIDLIDVNNNLPTATSIDVPYTGVERSGNITISVEGTDIEDTLDQMELEFQYKPPGGEYKTGNEGTYVDDHWEVLFTPGVDAPLGWYDIRVRFKDTDEGLSPWLEDDGCIEVQNSRPFVTSVEPESETVLRESMVQIEIVGWDPEDVNIYLVAQVQYKTPSGDWIDMSEGIEFSSDHWWATFMPDMEAETGDYLFRARLIDTADAQSDWYQMDGTIEVLNNLAEASDFDMSRNDVIRTEDLDIYLKGSDVEDDAQDLVLEAEMALKGEDVWSNSSIHDIQWVASKNKWALTLRPDAHMTPGDYELRVRFTDTDGDPGEWTSPDKLIKVINGPPRISLEYPDLVNEKAQVTFDASGSKDPEGGALQYSWDFGDGSTAASDKPSHMYKEYGSFTLKLTVSDLEGAMATQEVQLLVNALPVGVVSAVQENGLGNFAVKFDTSGSKDPDGNILTYRWDFDIEVDSNGDGDPTNDIDSTVVNPTFDYGSEGTYSYKLVMVDNRGASTEVIDDVTVSSMSTMTAALLGGVTILIIIAALVAFLLMKRKGKGSESANKVADIPPSDGSPSTSSSSLVDMEEAPADDGIGYGEISATQSYAPMPEDITKELE
jgi:PKD repeat protein